ncbi:MAG TPA: hypothetical protein VJ083_09110 [Sedimentibacter sp.]|nr:hypothetical protein [Sedimentibacter sp.]
MYKELFVGIIIFFLIVMALKKLYQSQFKYFKQLIFSILFLIIIAGGVYNLIHIFPTTYFKTVSGTFQYGSSIDNLFTYRKDFMFQDQLLFPILKNRNVKLDSQTDTYKFFFNLYSDSVEEVTVTEEERDVVIARINDFNIAADFILVMDMDYVTIHSGNLKDVFAYQEYPTVYIHTSDLANAKDLIAITDNDFNVYLMTTAYFEELTGGIQ